jgi:hypothetical protein
MNYGQVMDTIFGPGENNRFTVKNIVPVNDTTLGRLSEAQYSGSEFWHLLAAVNKDRGYFDLAEAASGTKIP